MDAQVGVHGSPNAKCLAVGYLVDLNGLPTHGLSMPSLHMALASLWSLPPSLDIRVCRSSFVRPPKPVNMDVHGTLQPLLLWRAKSLCLASPVLRASGRRRTDSSNERSSSPVHDGVFIKASQSRAKDAEALSVLQVDAAGGVGREEKPHKTYVYAVVSSELH